MYTRVFVLVVQLVGNVARFQKCRLESPYGAAACDCKSHAKFNSHNFSGHSLFTTTDSPLPLSTERFAPTMSWRLGNATARFLWGTAVNTKAHCFHVSAAIIADPLHPSSQKHACTGLATKICSFKSMAFKERSHVQAHRGLVAVH